MHWYAGRLHAIKQDGKATMVVVELPKEDGIRFYAATGGRARSRLPEKLQSIQVSEA